MLKIILKAVKPGTSLGVQADTISWKRVQIYSHTTKPRVSRCGFEPRWRSKDCHAACAARGLGLSHIEFAADPVDTRATHDVCPSLRSSLTEWIRVASPEDRRWV